MFGGLRRVKAKAYNEFGELDDRKFFAICSKLSTWHYKKKRKASTSLSKEEANLYEFMIHNKYNPSTVYKWMLVTHTCLCR